MTYEQYNSLIIDEDNLIYYISDLYTYDLYHLTKAGMERCGLKSPEEYMGRKCYELLHGLDSPCPFCTNKALQKGKKYCWERYNHKLNRWVEMEDAIVIIDGRPCRLERVRDITEQKQLSERLTMEKILVDCVRILATERNLDHAVDKFLMYIGQYYHAKRSYIFEIDYDNGTIRNTYEWCAGGVKSEIGHLQSVPLEYVSFWLKKFEETGEFYLTSLQEQYPPDSPEYSILKSQGIESLMTAPLVRGERIVGFLGVDDPSGEQSDLTLLRTSAHFVIEELEKRRLIQELHYASFTDMLTGLNNRNQYMKVLNAYKENPPDSLGVSFIDINGMKKLNDSYGHEYGDWVIETVAGILKGQWEADAYRIGGDEFVILRENIGEQAFLQEAAALREAFEADSVCEVSLGYSWGEGELDVNTLIVEADEKMYAEKQSYYKEALSHGRTVRTGIAEDVLRQIKEGRFIVYFQPQVDIRTQELVGAEALIRKIGPGGSIIMPQNFIPYYEIEGIVRHVDLYVLETACAAISQWRKEQIPMHVSVNFSRVTLMERNIVNHILDICNRYDVLPSWITIEVTESAGKMKQEELLALVNRLTKAGFVISLDDFGTKYSNLSILTAMNFNEVKLDKSLVDGLADNHKSKVILKNAIQMCNDLESTHALAEGIETKEQLHLLSEYACKYGQGYLFSKPLSFEEFTGFLKERRDGAGGKGE